MSADAAKISRRLIRVNGIVQGVGFRPFVYRCAVGLGLAGYVLNNSEGVRIEIEGPRAQLDEFMRLLHAEAPPASRIDTVETTEVPAIGETSFRIVESEGSAAPTTLISPDLAVCGQCLREMTDPKDRRHRYPFINCTHCGPRYTIVQRVPYDRPYTTMAAFAMCPDCAREYHDPLDRRFHAQPTACPVCGPAVRIVEDAAGADPSEIGERLDEAAGLPRAGKNACPTAEAPEAGRNACLAAAPAGDAIRRATAALADGRIVAIKGLGGFHLACDARNDAAVAELRRRKGREEKPLAVMVRDLDEARRLARLTPEDEKLLSSPRAPILLVPAREGADGAGEDTRGPKSAGEDTRGPNGAGEDTRGPKSAGEDTRGPSRLSALVAPGCPRIGIFLPYTPLHHLLLSEGTCRALVMTSGNVSEEPIAYENADGLKRLGSLADLFLVHDRPIYTRCDDSVVQRCAGGYQMLRRSRGYVPEPVRMPVEGPPVLGVGAELKGTICLTRGNQAFLSEHLGDLVNPAAYRAFLHSVEHLKGILECEPVAVACDLHPDYLSTRFALGLPGVKVFRFQHHYVHIAATMAETGRTDPVVGLSLDGAGFGPDGTVWGGELLVCGMDGCRRAGRLKLRRLAGGDAASREGWRMACSMLLDLRAAGFERECDAGLARLARHPKIEPARLRAVREMLDRDVRCPRTSSAGRLFDAISALLGICAANRYEGQAACALQDAAELCASRSKVAADDPGASPDGGQSAYPCPVTRGEGLIELDTDGLALGAARDAEAGRAAGAAALAFHRGLARGLCEAAAEVARAEGLKTVALGGGCFHNSLLVSLCVRLLEADGFEALVPRLAPAGDGAVSLGQAFLALRQVADPSASGASTRM